MNPPTTRTAKKNIISAIKWEAACAEWDPELKQQYLSRVAGLKLALGFIEDEENADTEKWAKLGADGGPF